MVKKESQFRPNYAVPPGETLRETLESLGMSQAELAQRAGRPKKTINEIMLGKAAITAETALQLERVLGIPASFWNNLERNYQETLARLEDERRLLSQKEWVESFPISALTREGWLPEQESKVGKLKALLNFFGVSGTEEWVALWQNPRAAYRTSPAFQKNPYAVSAWLRQGELEAQKYESRPYSASAFRKVLVELRTLTLKPPQIFEPRMKEICSEAGVAVVFVPEFPGTHVFGATRWLNSSKALAQLSLRGKSDDHLWFSFFHEAGHILLHGKREVFIEANQERAREMEVAAPDKEREADRFAQDFLIPPREYQRFRKSQRFSVASIREFAAKVGIAPGIVVGRLQHDKAIPFSQGNKLKKPFKFSGN